jgi:putative ABC transport system ATP-binding protein
MDAVELIEVRKSYMLRETRVEALRGVSLRIEKGEFLAIAGPSGAGKSTILNLIGCIDTPTEGRVLIDSSSDTELTMRK